MLADRAATGGTRRGIAYAAHPSGRRRTCISREACAQMPSSLAQGAPDASPTDVPAIRMLAEVAARRSRDARTCSSAASSSRRASARALQLRHRPAPANMRAGAVRSSACSRRAGIPLPQSAGRDPEPLGEYAARADLPGTAAEYPTHAKVWLSYGHVLKTEGDWTKASRRTAAASPSIPASARPTGASPTSRRSASTTADLAAMRAQLEKPALGEANRVHLHFALGKALRRRGRLRASRSSTTRRATRCTAHGTRYDADLNTERIRHAQEGLFTREFFAAARRIRLRSPRATRSSSSGMPRAGSTLLEQILSSHSAVEGTTRAARHDHHGPGAARTSRTPRKSAPTRRCWRGRCRRRAAPARRALPRAHAHPAQDGPAVLHRQDAEQLPARGHDPAAPARTRGSSTRGATRWPAASRTSSSTTRAASASATTSRTWAAFTATTST